MAKGKLIALGAGAVTLAVGIGTGVKKLIDNHRVNKQMKQDTKLLDGSIKTQDELAKLIDRQQKDIENWKNEIDRSFAVQMKTIEDIRKEYDEMAAFIVDKEGMDPTKIKADIPEI